MVDKVKHVSSFKYRKTQSYRNLRFTALVIGLHGHGWGVPIRFRVLLGATHKTT